MGVLTDTEATLAEAVRMALEEAMAEDERVILLGQDIRVGFPFGVTKGLVERFGPARVIDTPISEAATMGCGVGAAACGVRTVVEVDFAGFLLLGLDQLVNNAAKLRYMSGGQLTVPMVVRVGQGPLGAFAAQHSQNQHAFLASTPGLIVVAPSSPQDGYALMRAALRAQDPVVFCEDMRLYRARGPLNPSAASLDLRARVVRAGRDATVITFGHGVLLAVQAAAVLADEGVDVEVLDLRALSPLDREAIGESAQRTGRVLCLSDDPLVGGLTASLAVIAQELAGDALRAPVLRLGARSAPSPFAPRLESLIYPSTDSVTDAVRMLMTLTDS